jgi:calcineurin-like phosphoesterase family protein
MTVWITSDLHFGHKNIIKFCARTRGNYRDADHMNEEMILEWNKKVNCDDTVYILGDVAFCNKNKAVSILQRLNGTLILVVGNHDESLLKEQKFRDCFSEIHVYKELKYNGYHLVLFHFPIHEWHKCHRGSIHLHGHLHGSPSGMEKYRILDVGFDSTGQLVIPLDTAINQVKDNEILSHGSGE